MEDRERPVEEGLRELQESFVSIVSHELQTPVSIIKAYASALSQEGLEWPPETVRQVAATIEEECDRLHRLITDLLDTSRIQAGVLPMRMSPVRLPALIEKVVSAMAPRSANHRVEVECPSDFPIFLGDQEKLRRLLENLLDNAIKYSPAGGTIRVSAWTHDGHVVLAVHDHGIGIPVEEQERVFERFHRVDDEYYAAAREGRKPHQKQTRRWVYNISGVGLGLYICRIIAEAHGGRIWVESGGVDQGSTFYVAFPLRPPTEEDFVKEGQERLEAERRRSRRRQRLLPGPFVSPKALPAQSPAPDDELAVAAAPLFEPVERPRRGEEEEERFRQQDAQLDARGQ
jgi:signal transduction histidine kinase